MRTSEVTDRHTKEINILHVLAEYLFKTEFELKESILMNQIYTKSATEMLGNKLSGCQLSTFLCHPWHRAEAGDLAGSKLLLLCHQNGSFMMVSMPFSDSDSSWTPATLEHPASLLFPCRKWVH